MSNFSKLSLPFNLSEPSFMTSDIVPEKDFDTLNPKFGFTAIFPFSAEGHSINLDVKDWNKIGKAKPLGSLSIKTGSLEEGESVEEWFTLEGVPSGQVLVHVTRTKQQEEKECALDLDPEDGSPIKQKRKSSIFSFRVKSPRKVSVIGQ